MNTEQQLEQLKKIRHDITHFMLTYKFALDQMETRINILKQEFEELHDYSPIEHTKSRLKSPESIIKKMIRKNVDLSFPSIQSHIQDIAGLRIVCSFITDIYPLRDMLMNQQNLRIIKEKDYIQNPKPNGYQSLHLLIEIPVYMSNSQENVCVELQIRTIAMDFWASLEHKIFYKYNQSVPDRLLQELKKAAESANALDRHMAELHREIGEIKEANGDELHTDLRRIVINNQQFLLPDMLLKVLSED